MHPFGRWQLKLCSVAWACNQEQQGAVTTGDHEPSVLMPVVSLPGTLLCPGFVSADDFRLLETPVMNDVVLLTTEYKRNLVGKSEMISWLSLL